MDDLREKREIAQSEARDKTAKIISSFMPGGTAAYELITTLVVPLHEKKKREIINDLATRLKRLEDQAQVDFEELAKNEEFNTVITQVILMAQQNHQKEKLEALRNVVINAAVKIPNNIIEFDEIEYFMTIIGRINSTHIFLLQLFHNPNEVAKDRKNNLSPTLTIDSKQVLEKLYPQLRKKMVLVTQYWKDLNGYGLLKGENITIGRHTKRELQKLTTELGDKFLEMIESE